MSNVNNEQRSERDLAYRLLVTRRELSSLTGDTAFALSSAVTSWQLADEAARETMRRRLSGAFSDQVTVS